MKISISAVGRLRNSPEKELIDDYLSRFSKLSKPFGLSLNSVIEIEDKKGGGPISEKLVDNIKQDFGRSSKVEGKGAGDWVLVDAGDIIVHVFRPEVREFYQLEKMWQPLKE